MLGCVDNWQTGYNYYYGPGPSQAGTASQSVAYCPYYPNPTATVTVSPTSAPYGSTVTVAWSSTNASSCTSSDFNTNNYPSGSAQVTLNSSGSTKTFTVSCTNGVDASVQASATVTISNPATPASCTPWDNSKSNTPDYMGNSGVTGTNGDPSPTASTCAQWCSAYSNQAGKTVTCGLHSYSNTFGFGGPSYNGSSGSQSTTVTCNASDGATLYPASSYSYSQTTSQNGSMDSNDPNYQNWMATNGCFGPNPTQTCAVNAYSWSSAGATTCTFIPPPQVPTAALSASPTSIIQGNTSTLTWSSTNATSCTGTNFSTGGATSGSLAVAPGSTTSYSVTCTGAGGNSAPASATVSVTPALTGSCAVSPQYAKQGDTVVWTASPSGGVGGYTYSWSGTDSLSGSSATVSKSYSATGTKTASVTITSGSQTKTIPCSNSVTIDSNIPPPPTGLSYACNANGTSVTLSWAATPGATNYYVRLYDNSAGSYAGYSDLYAGTSITYSLIAGHSMSWWVHSNNQYGYSASTAGASFSCAGLADLTAGAISPTTATAGQQVSVSAAATNIGNGTSGSFPILFQVSQTGDLINSGYVSALPSGISGSGAVYYTFPSAGTYQVRACANYNTSWTAITSESNYSNNCGPWTDVVVSPAPTPDLTAGVITPTTAMQGQSVTFSATIRNIGTASTGAGFTTLFQKATNSSGAGATDIGTHSTAAMGAGSTGTASLGYPFASSGTFYLRACADKSSSGGSGTISESDETNNCGPWTAVAVQALSPTCSLSSNPSTTVPSTLTWSSANTTSCTGGGFSTGNATSGSASVSVAGPYSVSCTGPGGTCSASVNLSCGTSNPTITATPNLVRPGGTSHIAWSAAGGVDSSCVITENGTTIANPAGASCSIPNGSADRTINAQTVYKISCDGGEKTAQVIVNLIPALQEF